MIFFPITFIVNNQKSNGGVNGGMAARPPPLRYATVMQWYVSSCSLQDVGYGV